MDIRVPSHESTHIITHKHGFTQPNFLEFPKETQKRVDSHTSNKNTCSEIQQSALRLYDIGLNPFPLPIGKKGGYPWKKLQYTRLDRDDRAYGLFTLFSGECNIGIMCGRTSSNLFVIDCETPESLDYHIQQMQARQIPLWVAESGRGGHIYLLSAEGEVDNVPTGILRDTEVRGKNGYVLAPPSLHPGGKSYRWLYQQSDQPPTVSIQKIDWLYDTNDKKVCLSAHQARAITTIKKNKHPFSPLSRRTRDYIHNGHTVAEGNRNNELFRGSCDMAGNQFSKDETFSTLVNPARASGLDIREIEATINSAYSQPRTPSKPTQPEKRPIADWEWATLFGDHHDWSGRTGTSQRTIFSALIQRAKVSANEEGLFRASIREIASLARAGTATVQRILKSFTNRQRPYVLKCGYDKTSQATLWKFPQWIIIEAQQLNPDTLKESPKWLSCSVSVLSQPDAIERSALGYNGLLLYRAMVDLGYAMMPAQLSEVTGLADHQVKYALKKLANFDVVYRVDTGWVARPYDDNALDMKVQQKSEVIGKGEERAQRFAKERAVHAGRYLFYARLRHERNAFKQSVSQSLQTLHSLHYPRVKREHFPVYREVVVQQDQQRCVTYQRVLMSEVDEDDLAWIELAVSLGAEVILQDTDIE